MAPCAAASACRPLDPVPCRTASGPSTLGQLLAAYAYSPVDPLSSSELQKSDFALQLIAADAATHRGCGGPVLVSSFALGREGVCLDVECLPRSDLHEYGGQVAHCHWRSDHMPGRPLQRCFHFLARPSHNAADRSRRRMLYPLSSSELQTLTAP